MQRPNHRQEARLKDLIVCAKQLNIQVRTEKLLREVGYRAHSGRCRVNGQELIVIDRDIPVADQIEFLATELARRQPGMASQSTLASGVTPEQAQSY